MRVHLIRRGESLWSIARLYGLSWKALYGAVENADFRQRNPDPHRILPCDRIRVPADPEAILTARVESLRTLRSEMVRFFAQIEAELRRDHAQLLRAGSQVDTAFLVVDLSRGLWKMSVDAVEAMKLSGKELAEANRKFTKTHLARGTEAQHAVAQIAVEPTLEITGEEGLAWGIGKVLLNIYLEMRTPSWWAAWFTELTTGQSPEQSLARATSQLGATRSASLVKLDQRIRETEQLLFRERLLKTTRGP